MNKIAVVILNWNGEQMLRRFLPGVITCSSAPGVEICIADNASTDGSVEMIRREFPQVRLICLDANYGFADGYNKALAQVEARYVVLLNSDVEVTPGWLLPLATFLDTHPDMAACQPKLCSWTDRKSFEYAGAAGGYLDRYGYPFCRGRIFETIETDSGQYDSVIPVFWASGAALFIRLEIYRKVGGLDGRFFAHMEEIDLCWRMRSRGYKLACVPQSTVYHVGGATLKKENPRKTFLNFRNNLLMLYKNLPDSHLKRVMRMRKILDYLAAMIFLLKADLNNFRAVCAARKEYSRIRNTFAEQRKLNLQESVQTIIPEQAPFCVLFRQKLCRKKYFSQLSEQWRNTLYYVNKK